MYGIYIVAFKRNQLINIDVECLAINFLYAIVREYKLIRVWVDKNGIISIIIQEILQKSSFSNENVRKNIEIHVTSKCKCIRVNGCKWTIRYSHSASNH